MKTNTEQNLLQIKEMFQLKPQLYAHVIQFGITHGVLILAVHEGNFLQSMQFTCGGCFYFCGDFEGGPYILEISSTQHEFPNLPIITIKSADSRFMLKCTRLSELKPRFKIGIKGK